MSCRQTGGVRDAHERGDSDQRGPRIVTGFEWPPKRGGSTLTRPVASVTRHPALAINPAKRPFARIQAGRTRTGSPTSPTTRCHTRRVSRRRQILALIVVAAALAMLAPATAMAGGGGGSAGDQQYVDPLGGSSSSGSGHSGSGSKSGSTSTQSSAPSSTSSSSSTAPTASSSSSSSTTAASASASNTAADPSTS